MSTKTCSSRWRAEHVDAYGEVLVYGSMGSVGDLLLFTQITDTYSELPFRFAVLHEQ